MLVPLDFPPGIFKAGTEHQSGGRWYDSDLVRWLYRGVVAPIGGWQKRQHLVGAVVTDSVVSGMARGAFSWKRNDYTRHVAIGTHTGLYHLSESDAPADITPVGYAPGSPGTLTGGYGYGLYGVGLYGTPRVLGPGDVPTEPTTWDFDNWGEELVACAQSDGKIYKFAQADIVAQLIATAPISNAGVMVTDERYMMALGSNGNPREISWCDQEDYNQWTPGVVSRAGSIELQTSGTIMAGKRSKVGNLVVTDKDAHLVSYVGRPYIYSRERVGTDCGAVAREAVVAFNDEVAWMGQGSFWRFDGTVKSIPCTVADYVFKNLNRQTKARIWGMCNELFKEVTWHYADLTSEEPNRYVTWNWELDIWYIGALERTCGVSSAIYTIPHMVDEDGNIFLHEYLNAHEGREPYLEGGPFEIENGEYTMRVRRVIHDYSPAGSARLIFYNRFYPQGTQYIKGPFTLADPKGIRFETRQTNVRIESDDNVDWRYGGLRLDIAKGGKR